MATFRTTDLEIYFETVGSGPRVLVLNGSGGTLDGIRPLLQFLASNFEVAAHDQRGLGRTGLPTTPGAFTMAQYARDVAALLDHLGWPSASVVGLSFGGMVAQEFAVTWPERVERLALLCTSSGGGGGSSYPLHELFELAPEEKFALSSRLSDTRSSPEFYSQNPRDAALYEAARAASLESHSEEQREGERRQLDARRHHDVWERLGAVRCPTLVAGGRYDGIAPPSNAEAIASRVPDSELRLYEGGHMFLVQDRAALGDLVAFLTPSEDL